MIKVSLVFKKNFNEIISVYHKNHFLTDILELNLSSSLGEGVSLALAYFASHLILFFHLFTESHHNDIHCLPQNPRIRKLQKKKIINLTLLPRVEWLSFSPYFFIQLCKPRKIWKIFFYLPIPHYNFNLRGMPLVFYSNLLHTCKAKSAKLTPGKIIVLVTC